MPKVSFEDLRANYISFMDKIEDLIKMQDQYSPEGEDDQAQEGVLLIMSDLIELHRGRLESMEQEKEREE